MTYIPREERPGPKVGVTEEPAGPAVCNAPRRPLALLAASALGSRLRRDLPLAGRVGIPTGDLGPCSPRLELSPASMAASATWTVM